MGSGDRVSVQRPTGAGLRRQLVTLQQPANTTDPVTGEAIPNWTDVASVWAELQPLTSREQMRAKSVQSDTTHTLRIRYRMDVDTTWRVTWSDPRGQHIGNITGIVETERRAELELSVTETK